MEAEKVSLLEGWVLADVGRERGVVGTYKDAPPCIDPF